MSPDDGAASDSTDDSAPDIDPEDPMRDYLIAKRKEEKAAKKKKSKSKSKRNREDETPEERRARKERKKARKRMDKSEGVQAVEELLKSLDGATFDRDRRRERSSSPNRRAKSPSRTPPLSRDRADYGESGRSGSQERYSAAGSRSYRSRRSRSRSPRPMAGSNSERRDDALRHGSMDDRSKRSDHRNTISKSRFDRD